MTLAAQSRPGQPAQPTGTPTPASQSNQPTAPQTKKASFLDKVITRSKPHDWTLRFQVHISAYQADSRLDPRRPDPKPTGPGRQTSPLETTMIKFQTAAVVFPRIDETASSVAVEGGFSGTLKFDDKVVDEDPLFADQYPAGTKLARWEMRNLQGRQADLNVETQMTSYETTYDEGLAAKAVWPKGAWPEIAQSTFQKQFRIDHESPKIAALLSDWTNKKDPKSIPPAQLAKFLCKQVIETVQPSGNGETSSRTGELEGLDLQDASTTLTSKRGSDHDIALALAAVYRAAGLPCRTVIGYTKEGREADKRPFDKSSNRSGELRTWVEFALYDEDTDTLIWIPVDVLRIRKSSSRPPPLERPWKYFGTHDELDDFMPFAFQHHPPTTVVAQGSVAFWGWLVTPQAAQPAVQSVRFNAITTPKGGRPRPDKSKPGAPAEPGTNNPQRKP